MSLKLRKITIGNNEAPLSKLQGVKAKLRRSYSKVK
jgi:hypothetical protein